MNDKTPRRNTLIELGYEASVVFENPAYDAAIVGTDDNGRVIYDYEKMAECLMEEDSMTYEEAIEFIDYNTIRALPYIDNSPIILHSIEDYLDYKDTLKPYKFDAEQTRKDLVQWIKDWFEENGKGCNAIIGLSGGKDSTIAAALCVEALGADYVIGVSMPDLNQGENEAREIAEYLGIKYLVVPIDGITAAFADVAKNAECEWSNQTVQNIPPRVRMAVEYAIAQTYNGRPSCNCNLSEDWTGYATIFGDSAGSFAPLSKLTVTEIKQIGKVMGLPDKWVDKIPDDGLPHSTSDEVKFGFTYDVLDKYIREGVCEDAEIKEKIDRMHRNNLFKLQILQIPSFTPKVW